MFKYILRTLRSQLAGCDVGTRRVLPPPTGPCVLRPSGIARYREARITVRGGRSGSGPPVKAKKKN